MEDDYEQNSNSSSSSKNLEIGHNNHVIIQSMCNIETKKADEVAKQILNLEKMGCELIRVSCMDMEDAKAIKDIKNKFIFH